MVEASASYTDSINYLEVAFSPQNQINDDIISQIGYFNIGDYIGDPRQRSSSAQLYPELNSLSEDYFKKYIKQYDLTDFVKLIKFFDNSLFKMIKDFIPVRTSLASGLVVKQHLLERNKYPQPQVSYENKIYTGSIDMVDISGGPGGVFNDLNAPAPEVRMEFSTVYDLNPLGQRAVTASLYSTIRGKIAEYEIPSGSIASASLKMYDGEKFYVEGKLNSPSFTSAPFIWSITPEDNQFNSPYIFIASAISFNNPSSNFEKLDFGSTPLLGDNVIYDEVNWEVNVNYLPKDTLYKQDVNFQRWDESFPSLIGEIPKLHDNQDEFYDGEFSGSVILVTNGELNEECNGVKNTQILPKIEYNIRLYGLDYGITGYGEVPWYTTPGDQAYDIGNFLSNSNNPLQGNISITKMKSGSIFPTYESPFYNQITESECEFIKISNFSKNGIDISNTTSNLSSISILYNSGPLNYKVLTILSSTPDYTCYQVTRPSSYPEPTSSSLHTVKIDMTGSLENRFNLFAPGGGVMTEATYSPITSISTNPYNFYNPTTGEININTYTQNPSSSFAAGPAFYDIEITGSITVTGGSELYAGIYPNENDNPITVTPTGSTTGDFSLKISNLDSQFPSILGYRFGIFTTDAFPLTASLDLTFSLIKIEPYSSTPYSASVGVEPFTLTKFQNTDCDVLLGK